MREIMADLERWQREREDIALATVVAVRGSSPRPPGAHLVMTRGGRMAGSVSAGCVENDVYRQALGVLDGAAPVVASFEVSDAPGAVGLTCGGAIDVLIERVGETDAWRTTLDAVAGKRTAVAAVALEPAGLRGRRLAFTPWNAGKKDGKCACAEAVVGSIDPVMDEAVAEQARALLREGGATKLARIESAGAESAIFLEALVPPAHLFVCGATDIAAALARMAKVLRYEVTVVDARAAYALRERVPDADEIVCAWPEEVLAPEAIDEHTSVVTLSHDPKLDVAALACALRTNAGYIGALGSRKTHEGRKQSLREMGFSDADLARIHSPVGLDLGGRAPAEIALSILAEMTGVKHRKMQ
jgi:xanthine dehydrogenase accessory factor